MNISIIGHGHLAYITAACMEQFHNVNVDDFKVNNSELIWVCYDTPVNDEGKPDTQYVLKRLDIILPTAKPKTIVMISAQVPVGTCRFLQNKYPNLVIVCYPENLRRGKGIHDFMNQDRAVIGGPEFIKEKVQKFLEPLKTEIIWMNLESAEMVKHSLNAFLALSIAFINEINAIATEVGAVSEDITAGLKSDKRIGKLAYLRAGEPYTNETLGRDIYNLISINEIHDLKLNLIPSIKKSNDEHSNNR